MYLVKSFLSFAIVISIQYVNLHPLAFGQETQITSETHYTTLADKEGVYSEQVVRVFGANIEREFRLGVKKVEVYQDDNLQSKYPEDIQLEQYHASDVVPEQAEQFERIKAQYSEKMKQSILTALPSDGGRINDCLLYTSPSPRDRQKSRMPSSA